MWDVIVVGAGPAGLSAALVLGRCRRHVLVCDTGRPRNARSHALHGFLSRDGIAPGELRRLGREELRRYESVDLRAAEVTDARQTESGFEVTLGDDTRHACRKLLLATGVVDELPAVEGMEALYGTSVWHCPYCDGWEARDLPLAVYGTGEQGAALALEVSLWSKDLVLCTDGPGTLEDRGRERLARNGIGVREERIVRLEGAEGRLRRIVFAAGEPLHRRGLFVAMQQREHSQLAARLGCDFTHEGTVRTGEYETTCVPNLFVAGDASRRPQQAIVAAAEGATAAYLINTQLLQDDLA